MLISNLSIRSEVGGRGSGGTSPRALETSQSLAQSTSPVEGNEPPDRGEKGEEENAKNVPGEMKLSYDQSLLLLGGRVGINQDKFCSKPASQGMQDLASYPALCNHKYFSHLPPFAFLFPQPHDPEFSTFIIHSLSSVLPNSLQADLQDCISFNLSAFKKMYGSLVVTLLIAVEEISS